MEKQTILVYLETAEDQVIKVSLEALNAARQLAAKTGKNVTAVLIGSAAAAGAAAPAEEEKTEFDVILADVGANKMQVIKTVKELTGASLMEAKKLVETPNAKLKEQASKADAEDIQKKLAEVGAKVELK